jgi:hypothetical protein
MNKVNELIVMMTQDQLEGPSIDLRQLLKIGNRLGSIPSVCLEDYPRGIVPEKKGIDATTCTFWKRSKRISSGLGLVGITRAVA